MRTLLTFIFILVASVACADEWKAEFGTGLNGPEAILAVDKGDQKLMLFERKSPLHLVRELPCTTGQAVGDKQVRGDLRTPEGVYFLGPRIRRSLDWDLYGDIAYSLNYPNPIDRIKGKTGSGIWLHGRGKTLVPRDTRGCVALRVPDIESINGNTRYGTPVVIGGDVQLDSEKADAEAKRMVERVEAWADAWQRKSDEFFAMFDADKFSRSESGTFKQFRRHKERVFAGAPWIDVLVDDIKVMRGPDYWVTWFDQFYRSPVLTQTIGKRLYWQQDAEGNWLVVGREYTPAGRDLKPQYLEQKREEARGFVARWAKAWKDADLETYAAAYADDAVSGSQRGLPEIREYKKALWEQKPPVKVTVDNIAVDLHPVGLKVRFEQRFEDASGYSDKGIKTLVLAPAETGWKIEREDWRRR